MDHVSLENIKRQNFLKYKINPLVYKNENKCDKKKKEYLIPGGPKKKTEKSDNVRGNDIFLKVVWKMKNFSACTNRKECRTCFFFSFSTPFVGSFTRIK